MPTGASGGARAHNNWGTRIRLNKGTNQIAVKISAKASSVLDADAGRSSSSPAGKVGGLALRAALSARWVDPEHSLP